MGTMNISLPDDMKAFVDEQVRAQGYMSSSEYVRDLIRQQKDVAVFRQLLHDGANSAVAESSDAAFFADLRAKAGKTA